MKKKLMFNVSRDNYTLLRWFRIMKIMTCILLIGLMPISASVYSQDKEINVKSMHSSIKEVLRHIEEVSNYSFVYNQAAINVDQVVTVQTEKQSIMDILDEILEGKGIHYKIVENKVILYPSNSVKAENQDNVFTVKGAVTDADGEPLPGVNVFEQGNPTNGVITGIDGNYSIQISSPDAILSFTYIGFEAQDVNVTGRSNINITLVEEFTDLDEVVVVGYGTQRKVNLTGAVTTIDGEALESRPTENILKSLQGTVPGVTIIDRPGGTSISIRGRGTFAGASSPLYIVDGIEVSSDFFNNLDPTVVENISFLKDAASASIYGAKAAYGVVLVTTKQGKKEALHVTYNGSYGAQKATYIPEVLNSTQYAEMYRTSELNSGIEEANLRYSLEDIQKYRDGSDPDLYPNSNWFDLVLEPSAMFTKHSLNLSGGSDKVQYLFGLGYQRDESLTPGIATDRYNFLTKATADLKDWLTVSTNVNFIYKKYNN
ncbi:MAG: SusC/RagA family TonB-linked outer membrane protein, partial [Carboxylicivirga sp.]|nr:SusC/RagA family TonB-linked outer membrane protein [Carboxylicivirga sp.]